MTATAPVLAIRDVVKDYVSGDTLVRALDTVSLDVRAGEIIGIMGASGSGKSTLLLIAGLIEPPSRGEVFLAGERVSWPQANLDGLRDIRRTRLGFVFQKANLIPFLTAEENVALALEINGAPGKTARRRALYLLDALGLGKRTGNRPATLSGGEQQRVAIARALANDPALILADEPTAALDGPRGHQVMTLFRAIADTRRTGVMVVTHDPRALPLFDRTITLMDGRLADTSPPGWNEGPT